MTIQLLNALNKYYKRVGKEEVAMGPLERETSKPMTDQEAYAAAVDGRQFEMPDTCLSECPIRGDVSYKKG